MEDPFAAPSSSLGAPRAHKPTLSVLIRNTELPETGSSDEQQVDLPSVPALDHSLFAGEDFDASEFLLSRRHTALDELRSELRAYLATLRTSLVAVINTEYEAFIGLSLGLRHASVANSLSTIRRPVISIRSEVTRVKEELEEMREEMARVLGERKEVREAKASLRRLLEMEEAVEKVESLLKLGDSAGDDRDDDRSVDSPAKRLERVAGEFNHMLYLVKKAGDLPFVRSLDPRIAKITSTLQLDLSQLLASVLIAPSSPSPPPTKSTRDSLISLLRTYSALNLVSPAEEIFRATIVRPFVLKTIHRDVLNGPQSPAIPVTSSTTSNTPFFANLGSELAPAITLGGAEERSVPSFYIMDPVSASRGDGEASTSNDSELDPLAILYNKILTFISRECGLVLDVAERTVAVQPPASGADGKLGIEADEQKRRVGFELLSNVVWDEIANRLMSELGHVIFAAGRPSIFHQNYLLTTSFISRIESLSPTLSHLHTLRNHPTYITFIKRFQLPVYFQLRFKEIVTNVERALDVGSASGGGDMFVMSESEAVCKALKSCWSDEVYLEELSGRFWRLTLQLLSRYRTWINNMVPKYVLPSSASNANLSALSAGGAPSTRTSFDGDRSRLSSSGSRPGTPGHGDEVTEESSLRQLTVLIADSRLMEKKALELFESTIRSRLPGTEDAETQGDDSAFSVLRASLANLTSPIPSLSSQIITILVKRCAEHLKHVRSVASQVRASTRKGPAEPSYFVGNILKELKAYLVGPGRVVEEELRREWATGVVEEVAARYATILLTQKKTEDSYRWYKKGRQALPFFGRSAASNAPEEGASTDEDRVKMQMQLDVQTLGKEAEALGVRVGESEKFRELVGATADTAQAQGEEEKK
ncbi:oligomeric golgi complex component, COG2-domain-containing protein [Leucosporidium creatinivorum]|uniref:Conserved oligomeric Golgi complex subunit 2 n=1 Tax=Leucosporidium creatinivorum TaxID=106004 RepID=A0A1Y2G0H3_9BASI|nr:oligomeric golgi complex component, COG2-domain-containing protein [Leucosporidium creatinivorum]